MHKLILKFGLLCLAAVSTMTAYSQATWNGNVSSNWMDANNWTWTSGAGVPNANTDVIINNLAPNIATIANSNIAKVKSITLDNYSNIIIRMNAVLEIYGHVTGGIQSKIECVDATNNNILNSGIKFLGNTDQEIAGVNISTAKMWINKSGGDVTLKSNSNVYILDTLSLNATPQTLGTPSFGNIVIDSNASISLDGFSGTILTHPYTDNEIPPHIIMLAGNDLINFNNIIIEKYYNLVPGNMQFAGKYEIPIGIDAFQFSPLSINSNTDSLSEKLQIGMLAMAIQECTQGNVDISNSVGFMYQVHAFDPSTNSFTDTFSKPLNFNFKYARPTLIDSIKFGANMVNELYEKVNDTTCYQNITANQNGFGNNYHSMSASILYNGGNYTVVSTLLDNMDSIVINVQNNNPAIIQNPNGGTLQIEAVVYPSNISQKAIWDIISLTGEATVDTNGLVTASKEGTVLVIAKAAINPNFTDTISVLIGNISTRKLNDININISPNPAKENISITTSGKLKIEQLKILDIFGRTVLYENKNSESINIQKLQSGNYILQIIDQGGATYHHRFVKE